MKSKFNKASSQKRAFTMIELITSVLIIAILGSATVFVAQALIERSRDKVAVQRLTSLARMVQVKYTQAQGSESWEQVLVSATEEIRFTQGNSGLNAGAGVVPQPFHDTCNFDGTGCLDGQVSSLLPTQISYKAAVLGSGEYAGQSLFGLSLKSESGNCVMLRANVGEILDAWSTGRDMEGDCRGAIALGGPAAEAAVSPADAATLGVPAPVSSLSIEGGEEGGVSINWNASPSPDVSRYKIIRTGGTPKDPVFLNANEVCTNGVCSYSDPDATFGENYTYQIIAEDQTGYFGRAVTTAISTVPSAPLNLVATAGNARINLTWNAAQNSWLSGYKVYLNNSNTPSATVAPSARNIDLINGSNGLSITNGNSYSIELKAYNTGGESAPATAIATPLDVPIAPVVASCQVSNQAATVNWNSVQPTQSAPVSGYRVYVNGNYLPRGITTSATVGTITGLSNGTAYSFQVTTYGPGGEGQLSAAYQCTPVAPPSTPTNLRVTGVTAKSVSLAWNIDTSSEAPAEQFELYLDDVLVKTVTGNTATLTNLTSGVTHSVKIRALNNGTAGSVFSSDLNITASVLPDAPSAVIITQTGDRELTITWDLPESGSEILGYRIYHNGSAIPTQSGSRSIVFDNLVLGSTNTFSVAAYNANGQGEVSTTESKVAIGTPSTPTLTLTSKANNSATFALEIISTTERPVNSVLLQRCNSSGTSCTDHVTNLTTLSNSVTGTGTAGTSYTYKLIATNTAGSTFTSSLQTIYNTASAPTNVSVTQSSQTAVTLSWDPIDESLTGAVQDYQIYLNGSAILGGTSNTTSKAFTIEQGQEYTFAVAARTLLGTGAASTTVTVTPIGDPATPVVSNSFTYGNLFTDGTVSVTKSAGQPVSSVEFFRCATDGTSCSTMGTKTLAQGVDNGSSVTWNFRISATSAGTYRTYTVATNSRGTTQSSPAATAQALTVYNTPTAPSNVTVVGSNGRLTVNWTAGGSVNDTIGYRVYVNGSAVPAKTTSFGTNTTSFTAADGFSNGTSYTFAVAAYGNAGESSSSTSGGGGSTFGQVPTAPTVSSVNGGANNYTISVNWSQGAANGTPITSQLVRCWATSGGTTVPTTGTYYDLTPSASDTSGTVASIGFSTNTTFYCAVRTTNSVGDSNWSNVTSGGAMQGTYSAYAYSAYSYTAYSYTAYGYGNYGYSNYGYSNYGYSNYGYTAYSYTNYGYTNYGYTAYSYSNFNEFGCAGTCFDYSNYNYSAYSYSNFSGGYSQLILGGGFVMI